MEIYYYRLPEAELVRSWEEHYCDLYDTKEVTVCAEESKIEFAHNHAIVIKKSYHWDIDHKDACW